LAALAAVFLSVVGCTLPNQQGGQSGNNKNVALVSPVPSPTPTPTQQFAASAPAFHIGEVGVGYAPVAMTATGGVLPYHWTVISGAVPLGLSVGDNGTLSGVPTSPGKYDFTIQAADSGDSKATIVGSITIANRLNASLIPACAKYCTVELGCVNVCGNFGTQTGGVGPFTYSQTQGQLPSGTSLSGLSLRGTFGGQTGYLQFTDQVTDSLGATATVSPTFWMYPHIAWSGTYHCNGDYITACPTATIPFTGGVPGGTPTVQIVGVSAYCPPNYPANCPPPNAPPGGLSATATVVGSSGGGTVAFAVQARCGLGANSCPNGYNGAVLLRLVDQAQCASSSKCVSGIVTVDVYILAG
jgi:putative Ig domain-containing protein